MNERIKQLAEQAGITTNLDTDYFEKDSNKWVDYYSEKFAELIIQEMLVTCEEHPAWTGRMIGEQIKEHFGVQE